MNKYIPSRFSLGENGNVIDRFFYIISQQIKLTIKAMCVSGLTTEEADELEELKSFNLSFDLSNLDQSRFGIKDKVDENGEFKSIYNKRVGPTLHDVLSHYDEINQFIINDTGDELSKFEKLWYVYISPKIGHFHLVKPINLKINSLVLPQYNSDIDGQVTAESKPWSDLVHDALNTESMIGLIAMFRYFTQPAKIKELAKNSNLTELQTLRWATTYSMGSGDEAGSIVPWEKYTSFQHLLLIKLQNEVIFELED